MYNTIKTRPHLIGFLLLTAALLLGVGLGTPMGRALPEAWKQTGALVAGLLAIAGILWGVRFFARQLPRWFPVSSGEELTYTLADQQQFQCEYRFVTLLYFIIIPLISYPAYLGLSGLASLYYRLVPAIYLAPVDSVYWAIPAVFLGIALSGIPIWFFNRWRLKDRFPRLVAFFNQQYRYDQRKAGLAFTAAGLVLVLALTLAGLNLYLRLTPDQVAAGGFFGLLEDRHSYTEITRLEERIQVDGGNPAQIRDHTFLIEFTDGSRWQTNSFGKRPVLPVYRELLDFAGLRSGKPVETVIE